MKNLRLIPLLGALALFLGGAATASASTNVTKGKFSAGHNAAAASNLEATATCSVLNRACAKPDRFASSLAESRASAESEPAVVTMGRFQEVFIGTEIAAVDDAEPEAPAL